MPLREDELHHSLNSFLHAWNGLKLTLIYVACVRTPSVHGYEKCSLMVTLHHQCLVSLYGSSVSRTSSFRGIVARRAYSSTGTSNKYSSPTFVSRSATLRRRTFQMAQGYGQPGQTARGRDNQHPHPLYSRSPPESFPGAFLDDFPTPPLRVPVSSSVPRPPPSYPRGTHEAAGPSTPYTTSTDTKRNQPRLVGKRQETITRVTLLNPHSAGTRATSSQSPPKQMASTEELFEFSKVSVGDFERCLAFVESHNALDYRAAADKMLWQAYKTFERLHRRDFDTRHMRLVQKFANQCVQQYALLDFGADCGVESLKRYLHGCVSSSYCGMVHRVLKMRRSLVSFSLLNGPAWTTSQRCSNFLPQTAFHTCIAQSPPTSKNSNGFVSFTITFMRRSRQRQERRQRRACWKNSRRS